MKKLLSFALLGGLLLSLSACGEAEEPVALPTPTTPAANKVSADTKAIAEMLTGITLSDEIVTEVHDAATAALENGIEESYYFTDMLSDEKSKCTSRSSSTLGTEIRSLLTKSRNDNSVDADMLQYGDYQIYWPYSEHWDGVSTPVITFVPEDENQLWNYAYRITDAGVDTLIVDEEYMQVHPVWIVNKAEISYGDLPNFANGEIVKNGVMFAPRKTYEKASASRASSGPPKAFVYTVYLGSFKSDHQYDSIWGGSSEFKIRMGSLDKKTIVFATDVHIDNTDVKCAEITLSRDEIDEGTWRKNIGVILAQDWQPIEDNAAFQIYEEDGGDIAFNIERLYVTFPGKTPISCDVKMPYYSNDEEVYKTIYTRNFIFSTNSGSGVVQTNSTAKVFWVLPYNVGAVY